MIKNPFKKVRVSLPPEAPKKTVEQLQLDYTNLAASVGQKTYQAWLLGREIESMNSQLQNINFEAAAINAKQGDAVRSATTEQNGGK